MAKIWCRCFVTGSWSPHSIHPASSLRLTPISRAADGYLQPRQRGQTCRHRHPGPWKDWRIRTRHGRAIKFIETYCRPAKGIRHGEPLHVARFQREFLEEALAPKVDLAILAMPRSNGKSSLGGALAVWALFDDDETGSPQVPIIATTIGQAIRSCYGVAVSMIKRDPELLSRSLIYTGVATPRVSVPFNEGELFPISNDVDGLQDSTRASASWTKSASSRSNRGQPADGIRQARPIAHRGRRNARPGRDNALYHVRKAVREGAKLPGLVFHEYAAPEGCQIDDRKAWRAANPAIRAGFLRISALETDLGITRRAISACSGSVSGKRRRFVARTQRGGHLGRPARAFCLRGRRAGMGRGGRRIKRDSTAVVVVQRGSEGRLHATCRLWVPTADEPVDVTDVMQHLRELAKAYDVRRSHSTLASSTSRPRC